MGNLENSPEEAVALLRESIGRALRAEVAAGRLQGNYVPVLLTRLGFLAYSLVNLERPPPVPQELAAGWLFHLPRPARPVVHAAAQPELDEATWIWETASRAGILIVEGQTVRFANPLLPTYFGALFWHRRPRNLDRLYTLLAWAGAPRFRSVWRMLAALEPDLLDQLLRVLDVLPAWRVRRTAASLLGEFAYQPALPALRKHSLDQRPSVRRAADVSLVQMGDAEGIKHLQQALMGYERGQPPYAVQDLVAMGEPAVPPLLAALTDAPFAMAHLAAQALGRLRDARAFQPLVDALTVPREWSTRSVGSALAQYGERGLEVLLAAAHSENEHTLHGVAAGLGETGDERAVAPLRGLFLEGSSLRFVSANSLARLGKSGLAALSGELRNSDPSVREASAFALSQSGSPYAFDALVSALTDSFVRVRSYALDGLARIGDPRALDHLAGHLLHDQDAGVRQDAARALAQLGDRRGGPALVEALSNDPDHGVRQDAARALAVVGPSQAVDALIDRARSDPDVGVRVAAAEALRHARDARVLEPLAQLLHDPEEWVRIQARHRLALLGAPGAEVLLRELESPDVRVRREVVRALWYLSNPHAFEGARRAAQDGDALVRKWALQGLVHLPRDKRVTGLLIEALQDKDARVREAVVDTLASVGDVRAVEPLEQLHRAEPALAGRTGAAIERILLRARRR